MIWYLTHCVAKLLDSIRNVKKEPEENEDYEAPSTSKKRKRVFTEDSPQNSEKDDVFDSDEDFQVEKENPKKKPKNKHDLPKKTKAKPKPASISKQIVR